MTLIILDCQHIRHHPSFHHETCSIEILMRHGSSEMSGLFLFESIPGGY